MNQEQMERTMEFLLNEGAKQSERIAQLISVTNQDAENIRALAGIAEIHERRITKLEG